MNGMFQGEGSLASSQQGSSGIMSQPKKEESKPQKRPEKTPKKTPVSFNFQGEGGEEKKFVNTDSGTVVTDNEVAAVIAEYNLPPKLTSSYNNKNVTHLQTYLNDTANAPGLTIDGQWGPNTSAALRDYKKYRKELYAKTATETFDETGVVGSQPNIKLNTLIDKQTAGMINADIAYKNKWNGGGYKDIQGANKFNFGILEELIQGQTSKIEPLKPGQSIVAWMAARIGLDETNSKHAALLNNAIKTNSPGFDTVDETQGKITAWCASFLYAAIKDTSVNSSGLTRPGQSPEYERMRAHRYQDLGDTIYDFNPLDGSKNGSLEAVRAGDMIILNKSKTRNSDGSFKDTEGHVGIVVQRYSDGSVLVLGGNQDDSVSVKMYSPNDITKEYPAGYKINRLSNLGSTDPKLIAELTSFSIDSLRSTNRSPAPTMRPVRTPAPTMRPVPPTSNIVNFQGEVDTTSNIEDQFYSGIKLAEGTHGKTEAGFYTPVDTNDTREKDYKVKSKDVGYGHKIKASETAAKQIYGIPFINAAGDFIPLTEAQVETIYREDMRVNLELARKSGWDKKLKDIGTTWEALPRQYKLALMSLAYNVGGTTAGKQWTEVLLAAKNKEVVDFAYELRREDAGEKTEGTDNRVIRELKAARLISNSSEVTSVLPKATI